jgi:hypothetical protein
MSEKYELKTAEEQAREYAEHWVPADVYTGKVDEIKRRACRVDFLAGHKAASERAGELEAALDKLLGAVKCYNTHKPGYCVVCDVVAARAAIKEQS